MMRLINAKLQDIRAPITYTYFLGKPVCLKVCLCYIFLKQIDLPQARSAKQVITAAAGRRLTSLASHSEAPTRSEDGISQRNITHTGPRECFRRSTAWPSRYRDHREAATRLHRLFGKRSYV